jgi:hypothetical protein
MSAKIKLQPGTFTTRNARVVRIIDSATVTDSPVPGAPRRTRKVWNGELMNMDRKTVDSRGVWEEDGSYRNPRGTVNPYDISMVIKLDPAPVEPAPVEAAAALADPLARAAE